MFREVHYAQRADPRIWEDLYGNQLLAYAWQTYRGFCALLFDSIVRRGEEYDLVVCAGNSGACMLELLKCVFAELDIEQPPSILFSLARPRGARRNTDSKVASHLDVSRIENLNRGCAGTKRVLFIDDEISPAAWTLRSSLASLDAIFPHSMNRIDWNITAIAEDQGYTRDPLPAVRFLAFSNGVPGLFNTILHVALSNGGPILDWLRKQTGNGDAKQVFSILLGLPTRNRESDHGTVDNRLVEMAAESIPFLPTLSRLLQAELQRQVSQALTEVNDGTLAVVQSSNSL